MAKVKLPIYQRTQLIGGDFGTGDPYWDNVVLLVPFDDNVGTQEIDNVGSVGGSGSFVGTAAFDSTTRFPAGPHGPTSSILLDGNSDYITFPDNDAYTIGTNDFTIECDVYFDALPSTDGSGFCMIAHYYNFTGQRAWFLNFETNNQLKFWWSIDGLTLQSLESTTTPTLSTGVWYHVAVSRNDPYVRLFFNGQQIGESTDISGDNIFNAAWPIEIGRLNSQGFSNRFFEGRIDNVRITKGVGRYTENFTPPKAPYPNYKKRGPATSIAPGPSVVPWPAPTTLSYSATYDWGGSNLWTSHWNDDGTRVYFRQALNGSTTHQPSDFTTPYVIEEAKVNTTLTGVTIAVGTSTDRAMCWASDGLSVFYGDVTNGIIAQRAIGSSATAFNVTIGVNFGYNTSDEPDTLNLGAGYDTLVLNGTYNEGTILLATSNDSATWGYRVTQIDMSTANSLNGATATKVWNPTERLLDVQFDPTGNGGWALIIDGGTTYVDSFTCSTQWDISTASLDGNTINISTNAVELALSMLISPDASRLYIMEWDNAGNDKIQVWA